MRAREQQFHNAWRASAVSQESAGTTTPSTREKKKELNDVVGLFEAEVSEGLPFEPYAEVCFFSCVVRGLSYRLISYETSASYIEAVVANHVLPAERVV